MDSKDSHFKERRKHPRFDVSYIVVSFLKEQTISATAINISERGIGLTLPYNLTLGDELKIMIKYSLDDPDKKDVDAKAEVIWCKPIGGGLYRDGLELIEINELYLA